MFIPWVVGFCGREVGGPLKSKKTCVLHDAVREAQMMLL